MVKGGERDNSERDRRKGCNKVGWPYEMGGGELMGIASEGEYFAKRGDENEHHGSTQRQFARFQMS